MSDLLLHDFELDDECYKVRLAASLMGIAVERRPVNVIPGREPETAPMLALNPLGRLPTLEDGGLVLRDPQAIVAHLAHTHDPDRRWLPADPAGFAGVLDWLAFVARDLDAARKARAAAFFGHGLPPTGVVAAARQALTVMEDHMVHRGFAGAGWFVGDRPTIADVVLFPAFALSRDWGLDHEAFPALRKWARRMRRLPGFVTMPGIPDYA